MLPIEKIRLLMDNDAASTKKLEAKAGQDYYEGKHDIENHRIFFFDGDGQLVEDKIKSNIRISHPFHRELTDQVVQYLLSGDDPMLKSDIPDLQAELDDRFNENETFTAELYLLLTGVVAKGFDYMYAYKDVDDKTVFQHADSLNVVEVRANETDDQVEYLIYWYDEAVMDKTVRRIQVWDATQVYYYAQVDNGDISVDDSVKINPRPHTVYQKDGKAYTCKSGYGQIPFFRMDNFPKARSDLFLYKDLIDDYDLMNCGLSNNIEDTNESLYVVKGYDGDDLDELVENIRKKKHIGVDDTGDVDIKTVDIPVEARKAKMEMDEKNIYHFGQGLNTDGLKDTTATTNIAIKSAYTQLNARAVKLKIALKCLLRKMLAIVLDEVNRLNGTDYRQKDVYFCFEPEIPINMLENAQIALTEAQKRQTEINTLLGIADRLGNDLLMQLICEQLELDYDDIKSQLPDPEVEENPYLKPGVPDGGADEGAGADE